MKKLREWNLTRKILMLVVLLGALAAGITFYTLSQLREIDREYSAVLDRDARAAALVGAALLDVSDTSRLVYGVLVEQEAAAMRRVLPLLKQLEDDFLQKLRTLRSLIPEASGRLNAIREQEAALFGYADDVVDSAARWRGDRALVIIDDAFNPTLKQLRSAMESVREEAVENFSRSTEKLSAATRETQRNTTFATVLALIVTIGLALRWSFTQIARPIDRLAEEKARAEETARAKSAFLAAMSHEIRTPMNGVLGMLQLLSRTPLDEKQRDYVDKARDAGQLLLDLLNAVLDFSKIEAEKLAIEVAPFRVDELMQTLQNVLSSVVKTKPIAVNCRLDPVIPRVLLGDSLRLHQVLLNLAGNAVKFTEQGKVTVSVRLLEADPDSARLHFSVKDTGIGIEPDRLKTIFEAFTQADDSMARRFGGTGLGLSISRRLVNLMGGELEVESAPGEGSDFSFTITLGRNPGTIAMEEASSHHPGMLDTDLAGVNLLLVEDNPLNQQVAAELLERSGAEVAVAGDGQAAIDAVKAAKRLFDVILMDIQMPGMDGYRAASCLREELGVTAPILALSANTGASDRAASLAAGMNDHIAKPVDMVKLIAAIREHCPVAGESPAPDSAPAAAYDAPAPVEAAEPHSMPSLEGFDLAAALARLDGDTALYQMVALGFIEYESMISGAREALESGDREKARREVHTLKSVAGSLGAETLQNMAADAEEGILNGLSPEELSVPFSALETRLAEDIITVRHIAEHGFK
ncbi:MAG: ATP-binding protein [Aminivibrio sp.]|jgi:signal transduction histidine kinase/CheY-like chemotaxis protein/HPt (histidine-containing phosphotransfer) domain-containing protein